MSAPYGPASGGAKADLAQALPLLPMSIQQQGVVTPLSASSILRVYGIKAID